MYGVWEVVKLLTIVFFERLTLKQHAINVSNFAWVIVAFCSVVSHAVSANTLPENTIRIHYHRSASDYEGWGLHVWGERLNLQRVISWRSPLPPTGVDTYGIYFDVPIRSGFQSLGFILHKGAEKNVPEDMMLSLRLHGNEVWQLEGDAKVYRDRPRLPGEEASKVATNDAPASQPLNKLLTQADQIVALFDSWRKQADQEMRRQGDEIIQLQSELSREQERYAQAANAANRLQIQLASAQADLKSAEENAKAAREQHIVEVAQLRNQLKEITELAESRRGNGLSKAEQNAPTWVALLAVFLCLAYLLRVWLLHRKWLHTTAELDQTREHLKKIKADHATKTEQLMTAANFDELTGMANRALFIQTLDRAISAAKRYKRQLAVLFIDLDKFKPINDNLGHEAGDYVLKTIAERFQSCLREVDTLGRLGGDEFVVLVDNLINPQFAIGIAQKLLTVSQQPFVIDGQEVQVTASIGIATYPSDSKDANGLLRASDEAMYEAKSKGKNNFQFASEQMNTHSLQRMALESSLKQAINQNELAIEYTPIANATTADVLAVVPRVNWVNSALGSIGHDQLFEIADSTGLSDALYEWQLNSCCQQIATWYRNGISNRIMLSVASSQLIDAHFEERLLHRLEAQDIPKERLVLTVREGAMHAQLQIICQQLQHFSELGFSIAVTEFGSGYLSLPILRSIPVSILKIDTAFCEDLSTDDDNHALMSAFLNAGEALGADVVAQVNITSDSANTLKQLGYQWFEAKLQKESVKTRHKNASNTSVCS